MLNVTVINPLNFCWEGFKVTQNWSYRTTFSPHKDKAHHASNHLNDMGAEGWELVSVIAHPDEGLSVFFWKKPTESTAAVEVAQEPVFMDGAEVEPDSAEEQGAQESKIIEVLPDAPAVTFQVGDQMPEFELPSTNGTYFSTSQLKKKTVLYFYPADGTEGCTIQDQGFSAVYEAMADMGLDIIGVSPDTIQSHKAFKKDEDIPFDLLYDEASKVCSALGLLREPPPYEMLPTRTTFLVDTDKKILGLWNDIDVSTHSDDVVSFVLDVLEKAS